MNDNNRYPEEGLKSSVVINKINLMSELNLFPAENKDANPVAFNSKASGCKKEVPQETLKVVDQLFDDTHQSEAVDFSILPPRAFPDDDINMQIKGNNQQNNFTKGQEKLAVSGKENEAVAINSGLNKDRDKDSQFNLLQPTPIFEREKKISYNVATNIKNDNASGIPQVQNDLLVDFHLMNKENIVSNSNNKNQDVAKVGINEDRRRINELFIKLEELDKKEKKEDKATLQENAQKVLPKKNNPDDFFNNDNDFNFDFPVETRTFQTNAAKSTNIESKPMKSTSGNSNVNNTEAFRASLVAIYNNPVNANVTDNLNQKSVSSNIMKPENKQFGKEFKATNNSQVYMNPLEQKQNERSTEKKHTYPIQRNEIPSQNKDIKKSVISQMNAQSEAIMQTNNNLDLSHILDHIQLKDTNVNNNVVIFQENPKDIDIRQFNSNSIGGNLFHYQEGDKNISHGNINLARAESNDSNYTNKSKKASESKENIEVKRTRFVKDDYFSSFRNGRYAIVENRRLLSQYLPVETEALNLQVQSIVEDVILNSRDTDIIQHEIETLDMTEHSRQFTIGPLIGLDKAKDVSGIAQGSNGMRDISRDMRGCRMILNDGNGFYRAFIFSVIETFILSRNLYELKKIMFGLFTVIDKQLYRRDVQIDKFEIIVIFSLIISNLESNNITEAYDIFIKAYNRNHNFDYGLIKYIRIALADYIKANEACIFSNESQSAVQQSNSSIVREPSPLAQKDVNSLLPPAYGSNLKAFIDDCILSMDFEADRTCIYLAPILFNVNLDLHIVEGSSILGKKDLIYLKQTFPCLMNEQKLNNFSSTVSLLSRFAHYDRLYSHQILSENGDHFTFISSLNPQTTPIRITSICQDFLCDTCKRQCDLITFSHMPGTDICKLCLIDSMNKIISKRVKYFANDSYDNKEYYCRPIVLDERNNLSLSDEDAILLIGRTLSQHFVFASENMCLNCGLPFSQESNPVVMPCQCKICPRCVKEMIIINTDGKIILNNFEKLYLKIKPTKCPCGLPFDVDSAVGLTMPNIEEYLKDSNQRLVKYAAKYCILCRKDVAKVNANPMHSQGIQNYLKFQIIEESGDPGLHVICKECVYPLKADIYDKIKKRQIPSNPNQVQVKCSICLKKHFVEYKTLKFLLKGDDSGCCSML